VKLHGITPFVPPPPPPPRAPTERADFSLVLPPQGGRTGSAEAGPSGRDPTSARGNAPPMQAKRAADAAPPADSAADEDPTSPAPYMRGALINIQA
jgi:hypothetical protein